MNDLPDKRKSHYILIGVGKRPNDEAGMAITADDARYLQRALNEYLFLKETIPPLLNETATKRNILDRLEDLAKLTQQEQADLVIMFFSGHGGKINGTHYLICNDTTEDVDKTAIEGREFVKMLLAIKCNKMLVLLDCCHASGMRGFSQAVIPFDESSLLALKNRVILTSCRSSQYSYLSNPVSVFTYAVIEALGGKFLTSEDKKVSLFNFAMDVRERVVALILQLLRDKKEKAELEKQQQPELNAIEDGSTTNFVLTRYPKGGPQPIRLLSEISALEYAGKAMNMDVTNVPDTEERKRLEKIFNVSAEINITNSKNVNAPTFVGNKITIGGDLVARDKVGGNIIYVSSIREAKSIRSNPEEIQDIVSQNTSKLFLVGQGQQPLLKDADAKLKKDDKKTVSQSSYESNFKAIDHAFKPVLYTLIREISTAELGIGFELIRNLSWEVERGAKASKNNIRTYITELLKLVPGLETDLRSVGQFPEFKFVDGVLAEVVDNQKMNEKN
jgi:uncharacterized caspase-like protein